RNVGAGKPRDCTPARHVVLPCLAVVEVGGTRRCVEPPQKRRRGGTHGRRIAAVHAPEKRHRFHAQLRNSVVEEGARRNSGLPTYQSAKPTTSRLHGVAL